MGVIQQQAIKGTVYAYIGVGVGFVTTLLIYPRFFSTDQVGLIRLLVAYSALFAQLATLGFPRVTTMMFTYFRDYNKKHNGFFFIALMVSLVGLILSLIIFISLKPLIIGKGAEKSILFADYFYYIIPLIIFTLFFVVFDNYYKVLYNSVQGTFLKEFLQKTIILGDAILFMFGWIDFRTFIIILLVAFMIPAVVMMILLIRDKQFFLKPDFSLLTPDFKKRMANVSFFGILTSFSGIMVLNIDSIMINAFLDLSSTGVYTVTFFFGTVILIPSRSLLKISSVVIADAWKANDKEIINKIYYKSCLNQLIFASLLFIGIWGNIHNVFNNHLLPPAYEPGKYVIFFISLASLIQMAGGTSNMILFTSGKYRVHTWFMLTLVSLLIVSNLILIPVMGIVGAAIASAASFLVFNILKFIYLNRIFGFKPYDYRSILVVIYAGAIYALSLLLPRMDSFVIDILVRSAFIAVLFISLILATKISEELNQKFDEFVLRRIFKR